MGSALLPSIESLQLLPLNGWAEPTLPGPLQQRSKLLIAAEWASIQPSGAQYPTPNRLYREQIERLLLADEAPLRRAVWVLTHQVVATESTGLLHSAGAVQFNLGRLAGREPPNGVAAERRRSRPLEPPGWAETPGQPQLRSASVL